MLSRAYLFAIGVLMLAAGGAAVAADSRPAWRRWAVVCAPNIQKTGLGDLLTVELSKSPDVELVEREELSKIVQELELSQLGSAENAAGRLKLGRLLRADALALVQRAGPKPKSPLRLIIAECLQGARLHEQEFAAGAGAERAAQIAKVILATRSRFPRGITQLLGVSDFVSHNLTHDYDAMQSRYAGLLRATLSLQEGVAVLEMDEARSIARELARDNLGNRRLPLIVDGEFQTELAAPAESPAITLRCRLTGGSSIESIQSPKLALAVAPAWIAGKLAQKVLHRAEGQKPLGCAEQAKLLTGKADEFTALAAWERAVKLREAALLVEPAAAAQRLKLTPEYLALISRVEPPDPALEVSEVYPGSPSIIRKYGRQVQWYLLALEHVEYLICNRQIDREQALDLCRRLLPESSMNPMPERQVIRLGESYYRIGQEELARAQKPARRFFLEIVPKILELPPPASGYPATAAKYYPFDFPTKWQAVFLEAVRQRTDVSYMIPKDLADLTRAYTKVLPDGLRAGEIELAVMPSDYGPRAAMPADYMAMYRALAASPHKVSAIRGRYMLLEEEARDGGLTRERAEAIVLEVHKLKEEYRTLFPPPTRSAGTPASGFPAKQQFLFERRRPDRLCAEISTKLLSPRRPEIARLPQSRLAPPQIGAPAPGNTPEPPESTGAVRFAPVALTIKRLDGSVEEHTPDFPAKILTLARGMDIVHCGTDADVYCGRCGLFVMRKRGLLDELIGDEEQGYFRRAVWDGRQVWAARHDGSVWIVGMDGKLLVKVAAAQGLPPAADGPLLYPLSPGRVLALGSFGNPPRAWAAEMNWSGRDAQVRVFFEAKQTEPPGARQSAPREALDLGFHVRRIHPYQPKGESSPALLLVERAAAHPLQINLKTLAVSEFQCDYIVNPNVNETIFFVHNGMLFVGHPDIQILAPPNEPWPDGKFLRRIPLANPAPPDSVYQRVQLPSDATYMNSRNNYDAVFLDPGDGYLYFIGQFWHRIKLSTLTAERLNATFMPREYGDCRNFGVSAHYGLVAWKQGQLLRITVDEASIP